MSGLLSVASLTNFSFVNTSIVASNPNCLDNILASALFLPLTLKNLLKVSKLGLSLSYSLGPCVVVAVFKLPEPSYTLTSVGFNTVLPVALSITTSLARIFSLDNLSSATKSSIGSLLNKYGLACFKNESYTFDFTNSFFTSLSNLPANLDSNSDVKFLYIPARSRSA